MPYYLYNFVLFPVLAGPLFWKVLLGNVLAEVMRDVYSACTIFCGHVGHDVKSYPPGTRAHGRGQWYAMQVEATNNFEVSRPVSVLCGGLDRQIEHHLFPALPPAAPARDRARGPRRLRALGRRSTRRTPGAGLCERPSRTSGTSPVKPQREGACARSFARWHDAARCVSHAGHEHARRSAADRVHDRRARRCGARCRAGRSASTSRAARSCPPRSAAGSPTTAAAHIERLKLIAQLQDRGLRIDAIRDLLTSIDRGEVDLAEWLGVEQQVQRAVGERPAAHGDRRGALRARRVAPPRAPRRSAAASHDRAARRRLPRAEPGPARDRDAARGGRASTWGRRLRAEGLVRKHIGRAAGELVEMFVQGFGEGAIAPREFGPSFESLRSLGMERGPHHLRARDGAGAAQAL